MKKCITLLLTITLALYHPTAASAAVPTDATIVETFEDGSYIETVIEEATFASSARSTTSTVSGKKTNTYRNSEGSALWSVTVTGTFTYNGSLSGMGSNPHIYSTTPPAWIIHRFMNFSLSRIRAHPRGDFQGASAHFNVQSLGS